MGRINTDNYEAYVLDYLEGNLSKQDCEALKHFALVHPELNIDLDAELPAIARDTVIFSSKEDIKRVYSGTEEELLEYLENTMASAEKQNFEYKLEQDPKLAAELKAFQKTILPVEPELEFNFKSQLHKDEDALYLNNKALQYLEGEFTHQEALNFENELAFHSELGVELGLYRKTKLVADTTVIFENKASLKKEALVLPLFRARVVFSAAAAIALIVFLSALLNSFLNPNDLSTNKPSIAVVSPKLSLPKTATTKQSTETKTDNNPKVQEQLAANSNNSLNIPLASPTPTGLNEVLVQTASTPDTLNNQSLALENVTIPISQSDKESLDKLEYAYLIPFEEEEEEENPSERIEKRGKGFWSFATRLAKKANQIGIKSINGTEDDNNHYLLSFNAMTIEKK